MARRDFYWRALRGVFFFLIFYDLAIAIPGLFFPEAMIDFARLNADDVAGAMYRPGHIEPIFLRGLGVLWVLASYVQYLAWRDPERNLVAVNVAIVFRGLGAGLQVIEALLLLPLAGFGHPTLYVVLVLFFTGDFILLGTLVALLRKVGLPWWVVPFRR